MNDEIGRVAEAIRAFARGEIVLVTDDDDRENEGDLFVAAAHCTPEKMAFIIRHTSGIVCAPLSRATAVRLRLDPMVPESEAPLGTAFTVSVDVRHGVTTGISAEERTATVRALADDKSRAGDFVRPGHVFPLIARDGGVLMRSGHTEACVDLCRLAGLPPVGVLAELVNDDGTVMRGEELTAFAAAHGLTSVSVAELITYRQRAERLVERVHELAIETRHGAAHAVTYRTPFDPMHHLALVFGEIKDGHDVLVRLQREQAAEDLFGASGRIDRIMERIARDRRGVLVYLREGSAGVVGTPTRTRDLSQERETHRSAQARRDEWREIGLGAQILTDLGVRSIRLLASRERRYVGLGGFGIEISQTEIFDA